MNHISHAVQTVRDLRHRWKPHKERLNAAGGDQPTTTYGGKLNRTSLKRCVVIMQRLLPTVLGVWIDHRADEDWGAMCSPMDKLLGSTGDGKPGMPSQRPDSNESVPDPCL